MTTIDQTGNWRNSTFVQSLGHARQLLHHGHEVAFAGRSNAGKSSTLNCLCEQKGLARTSRTPGRTQLINLFSWGETARLADLPGYGYAKAPEAVRKQWADLVQAYFAEQSALRGVVVIMDARRPLTTLDQQMIEWSRAGGHSVLCLLNKADKLSRGAAAAALQQTRRDLRALGPDLDAELFSATTGLNVDRVRARIAIWLQGAAE